MDFGKLTNRRQLDRLTSPRDIFAALPSKAPGFGYLRDVQGQVLDSWEKRRTERDLAIKMNTGAGKTLVGLLILQSSINEGEGPAAYVAPSPYLAAQVRKQAEKLGIATVDDPESIKYLSGDAIAVINIHKLVNGRSVFGGPGSGRTNPLPIGTVVIDDAHAALATTESQSTIVIPREHGVYERLLHMFRDDLERQSQSALLDILDGDTSAVLRVPFWAWADRVGDVSRELHQHREEDPLLFAWPLVADSIAISQAVFTASALEIRPPFPPTERISSFAAARRRIYLTATLADDSVLVSDFNADGDTVSRPITPATAADLGDRLILAPQETNARISDQEVREALRGFANEVNVVVLVPSYRRAQLWGDVADHTVAAEGIADAVEQLQSGHQGLTVLVNKYDGIDLPEDACRILVIDGLPGAFGGIDRRDAVGLGETEALIGRQLQRIEQGMGRGVRSADDYCVVILLGARVSQLIADRRYAEKFSPATRAQLELSREVAAELEGKGLDELATVIRQVLARDAAWVAASRSVLAGVTYAGHGISPDILHARAAFNAATTGQFQTAVDRMSAAVESSDNPRVKGWHQEQLAVYQHQLDPVQAQHVLAGAVRLNPRVTKPIAGVTYRRLTAAADQAQAAARFLADAYPDRNSLLVGINALLDDLAFDPEHTEEFEDAIEAMAKHVGFAGQRPERDQGSGPDVLWAIGSGRFIVIECKSGAAADNIWRRDVAQLAHSISWFEEHYDSTLTKVPVLVHRVAVLARNAAAPAGCRIMTEPKVGKLRVAVRGMAVALADAEAWGTPERVEAQLRLRGLTGGDFLSTYTVGPRRSR